MNFTQSTFRSSFAAMLLVTLTAIGFAGTCGAQAAPPAQNAGSAQTAAPAPPPSFCGNQPLCYEAPNFAATVTDFRTSVQGGYRIIDTVIRFQNKTPNPVILGYVVNSGTAMDDRGNRYIVYGANGYRGIGQVYGNNFDPRFTLSPGGYGDAQFELMWAPGQQIYGFTFDLSMSVDEINTVEGNQHTLGGEFPLIFKGLSNGASSNGASGGSAAGVPMTAMAPSGAAAPGQPAAAAGAAQPGCAANGIAGTATSVASATGSAAAQNAAGAANSKVSSATNAISSLSSIFGHKKKPAAAAPSAAPCPQAAPAVAAPAPTPASVPAQTMSNGAAPAPASPATVTNVSASTTTAPATTAAAAPAATKKPAPATKKSAATPKKPVTPATPNKPSQK